MLQAPQCTVYAALPVRPQCHSGQEQQHTGDACVLLSPPGMAQAASGRGYLHDVLQHLQYRVATLLVSPHVNLLLVFFFFQSTAVTNQPIQTYSGDGVGNSSVCSEKANGLRIHMF